MFKVHDGDQVLMFRGERLSHATTNDGKRLRWTEVEIYRTEGGKYVTTRVGKSLVYHDVLGCGYGKPIDTVPASARPCPVCRPDDDADLTLEQDRCMAQVSSTPEGVIEFLTLYDDDDVRYIPAVNKRAILEACEKDEALHTAYAVYYVE